MKTQDKLLELIGKDIKIDQKQAKVGPYTINYVEAGSGRPVLMLHGANIGWPQWYKNIAELAGHFKVYALDLPGAGSSTTVDFYKTDLEKDFVVIVDQFVKQMGLDAPGALDLIGSSFGGWIAMRLAILGKPYVRRVVVVNPIGFTAYMPFKNKPVSFRPLAKLVSKTALRPVRTNKNLEMFMRDVFHNKQQPLAPEFVDYFYELSKTSHNLIFISRLSHWSGMRKELFLKDDLRLIKQPTLVVWGVEDPLMPWRTVEPNIKLIPNVTLKRLEGVGHMPPVEASEAFDAATIKFLET